MRSPQMQSFLSALEAAFAAAPMPTVARAAVDRVFAAACLPAPPPSALYAPVASGVHNGESLPVTALFPEALRALIPRGDALGGLARALQDLAPNLVWSTRKAVGPSASAGFAQAHANCFVMGPGAIQSVAEPRDDLWIGISLMAPDTRYPDHDHAPEEVYLVLTPGEFWHRDSEWITPGIGGTVHNTPGIRHAMRSGSAPFLAIWVLPV
jgi:hypothetical protein